MWTTTPEPMIPVHEGLISPLSAGYSRLSDQLIGEQGKGLPLGSKWKAKVVGTFSGPMGAMIVWPALFPPAHLAQMSTLADRISTNLPFPSSPHCDPKTTVTEIIN